MKTHKNEKWRMGNVNYSYRQQLIIYKRKGKDNTANYYILGALKLRGGIPNYNF